MNSSFIFSGQNKHKKEFIQQKNAIYVLPPYTGFILLKPLQSFNSHRNATFSNIKLGRTVDEHINIWRHKIVFQKNIIWIIDDSYIYKLSLCKNAANIVFYNN